VDHSGHIAVVSGAAQGIGREYARALAQDGALVVAADLKLDGAEETVELIKRDGGRAVARTVDVSDPASTRALAEGVANDLGNANILVNNAAIYHSMQLGPVLAVDIAYWRTLFSVNLDGALLMTQAFAPQMIASGWGRVVNQTSTAAYSPGGAYSATKVALISLTQSLARELGPHGITVNAIAPGPIFTDATLATIPERVIEQQLAGAAINARVGPEALVGTLRHLCGDGASWVTGQTLLVDGGITKRI
jgi:NAD(P)-dependent dehydrogenase (short-subunit alcohol dehydrogenase family)